MNFRANFTDSNDQTPEVLQPGKQPLDFPPSSISLQPTSILRRILSVPTMWSNDFNAVEPEVCAEAVGVVGVITNQLLRGSIHILAAWIMVAKVVDELWFLNRTQVFSDLVNASQTVESPGRAHRNSKFTRHRLKRARDRIFLQPDFDIRRLILPVVPLGRDDEDYDCSCARLTSEGRRYNPPHMLPAASTPAVEINDQPPQAHLSPKLQRFPVAPQGPKSALHTLLLTAALIFAAATVVYSCVWMYYVRLHPHVELGMDTTLFSSTEVSEITKVEKGSPADEAGLRTNDRIIGVNGKKLDAYATGLSSAWSKGRPAMWLP
jgi:hypothetical protein